MEETIAKWIIEYFLRRRSDDKVINALISSLPLAVDDYRLKKTMLLHRIETEASKGWISEKIVELIEIIEALDHEEGKMASELMKAAYCLVAVDCTVRFLVQTGEKNEKYMEAVENLWRNRVCKSAGLVSEMSKRWFDDIEAAGNDSAVHEKLWMRNTRNEAMKAVIEYVKEQWECLGPTFLEVVAAKVGDDVEGTWLIDRHGRVYGGGSQQGQPVVRRKHYAVKTKRPRGARLSDVDEEAVNTTGDGITETEGAKFLSLSSEMDKAKEAISTGFAAETRDIRGEKRSDVDGDTMNKAGDGTAETVRAEDRTPEINRAKETSNSGFTQGPSVGVHVVDSVRTAQTLTFMTPLRRGVDGDVEAEQNRRVIDDSLAVKMQQRELRERTRELLAAVCDPLPEALKTAQTCISSTETNNHETAPQNRVEPDMPTSAEAVRVQTAQEPAEKTIPNSENNAEVSKQAGREGDPPRGSAEDGSGNVKETARHDDADEDVTVNLVAQINLRKRKNVDAPSDPNEKGSEDGTSCPLNEDAQGNVTQIPEAQNNVHKRAKVDAASKGSDENVAVHEDALGNAAQDPPGAQDNARKRSLMEPNDTSHTFEWEDDIENSAGSPVRPMLPSPNVQRPSPLRVPEYRNLLRRRERKKWSSLEEDMLREGVQKYGKRWKLILTDSKYVKIFEGRTDVDLKDKWRNMSRHS